MKNDNVDVIVVGAGPVGLTLACELRLADLRVTVLERRAKPVAQSRALTMHGRTVEMLAQRGVADRFLAAGMKIPTGHFAGLGTRLDFSVIDTTFPFTLFIPQSVTEQLLEAWALELGVDVRRNATVERIAEVADGVSVLGQQSGTPFDISGSYVVGADGARSLVRQHAGIAYDGLPATKTVMLGDVRLSAPPSTPGLSVGNMVGGLMVVPLGGGLYRVIVIDADRMDVPLTKPVTLEELSDSTRRVAGQDFGLHAPEWLSRFSNETRLASAYRKDRMLLVGDAAHIHLPAGGQGMNVGMQDAMNLGWKLAGVVNGLAPESLLESYRQERHAVGAALYQNTLAQSALMMNSFDAPGQALRETFSELMKIPALNAALAHDLSGYGIRYPAPLADVPQGWALLPDWTGRRLSDWQLQLDEGGQASLFSFLRSGRWLLLQLTNCEEGKDGNYTPQLDARWVATVKAVPADRQATLAGVHALLIRPDGYVDHAVAHQEVRLTTTVKPNLDALYTPPSEMIQRAVLDHLVDFHEAYLKAATFFCLATGSEHGLDASPRGGPPGFVHVLDPHTVAFADWPGNNRIESMHNLEFDDRVGMLFLFPGLEVFMRINGCGRITTEPDLLALVSDGERTPKTAIVVSIKEVLFHCGKAINRAQLWADTSQLDRSKLPTVGKILVSLAKLADVKIEQLDALYDHSVRNDLY